MIVLPRSRAESYVDYAFEFAFAAAVSMFIVILTYIVCSSATTAVVALSYAKASDYLHLSFPELSVSTNHFC